MTYLRPTIEIQVPPDIMTMLFRAGATIHTKNGFVIHLKEGGVPKDYYLRRFGVSRETRQFVLQFSPRGQVAQGEIIRVAPVYEKEEGA
jgi:hypothetical protein